MNCRSLYDVVSRFVFEQEHRRISRLLSFTSPFVLIYLALRGRYSWLPGWSCPIRHTFGVPCPGCYLTRSITYSLNGQLGEALQWHVMGPPVAISLLAFCCFSILGKRLIWTNRLRFILILSIAALFIVWLARIVAQVFFHIKAFPADPLLVI